MRTQAWTGWPTSATRNSLYPDKRRSITILGCCFNTKDAFVPLFSHHNFRFSINSKQL